jgi:hypothetical protein
LTFLWQMQWLRPPQPLAILQSQHLR